MSELTFGARFPRVVLSHRPVDVNGRPWVELTFADGTTEHVETSVWEAHLATLNLPDPMVDEETQAPAEEAAADEAAASEESAPAEQAEAAPAEEAAE